MVAVIRHRYREGLARQGARRVDYRIGKEAPEILKAEINLADRSGQPYADLGPIEGIPLGVRDQLSETAIRVRVGLRRELGRHAGDDRIRGGHCLGYAAVYRGRTGRGSPNGIAGMRSKIRLIGGLVYLRLRARVRP